MAKLFLQHDIRTLDALTIERQGITSLQLMERAAQTVSEWIMHSFAQSTVVVLAGPGNNGGDGLVVARHLALVGCTVVVFSYTGNNGHRSADCAANWQQLPPSVEKHENELFVPPLGASLIVDALLGTGLNRPVGGLIAQAITDANQSNIPILSIDIPSGMGDEASLGSVEEQIIVRATWTISFQWPKINFLMPESEPFVGQNIVTDIGISESAIADVPTSFYWADEAMIRQMIKPRSKFAHKGTVGKALLVVGSKGMMGAVQLSAKACLRSGVGLLTTLVPECGYQIMQIGVPEAMTMTSGDTHIVQADVQLPQVDAIGIGPGLGRNEATGQYVAQLLHTVQVPMVVDADALWHVAQMLKDEPTFCAITPTIFTPHEGEFDRLTNHYHTRMERIEVARLFAKQHNVVLVLKGAHTAVCMPNGNVVFNSTGNAGMATGGSGDVLTGIITALLAQGYDAPSAAIIGVYMHGKAGDMASKNVGEISLIASDIISCLGLAFKE